MPASRTDAKAPRNRRREQGSPASDSDDFTTTTTTTNALTSADFLTEEQRNMRSMIPTLTPAHSPDSTSSAILAALSLGEHRPNSHTRRKSEGHVNRPPNAFIVFRRAQVQNMPPSVTLHQQRISNLTAAFWRVLTHSEQNTWYSLSDDIKKLHSILFPEYNFNPRNPDGSKKASPPRAGLTPERYDFAWNEAQILIAKHTTMGNHPPAPPASCDGKLTRPKPSRKGQGTRARERREREAAERAAAISQSIAAFGDEDFSLDNAASSCFQSIEEESNAASPNDPIAWAPDFTLEGSISSRSSPSVKSNTWPELISPLDTNNVEIVNPLDMGYGAPNSFEEVAPSTVEGYSMGHFNPAHYAGVDYSNQVTPTSYASIQKANIFEESGYVPISSNGAAMTFAPYYEAQGPLHARTVLHPSEMVQNHSEAQFVFHDMDPTMSYLDVQQYGQGVAYTW